MCGRFTLTLDANQFYNAFPWLNNVAEISPRYNIAPSQPVAVVSNQQPKQLDFFSWGLIPSWAKDPSIANRLINARSETIAEKPSFRNAYRRRRCLVLADGFFEWQSISGKQGKTPFYFRLKSGEPFAFAGLWENWHALDGSEIRSCTIITTDANSLIEPIHDRMPVILPKYSFAMWLNPFEQPVDKLNPLLIPFPAEDMTAIQVSPLVNNAKFDTPECIFPG
ncbi:MAG: SOS response-associated peptidase [Chloroflexota bacterium]|jgi:putative SOS response-associated peptidase YedK